MNYRRDRYGSQKPKQKKWRKKKTPPPTQRPSVVRFIPSGKLLAWDDRQKLLYVSGDGSHHVFPAKNKAQSAVWHTVQVDGTPGGHVYYVVEDA